MHARIHSEPACEAWMRTLCPHCPTHYPKPPLPHSSETPTGSWLHYVVCAGAESTSVPIGISSHISAIANCLLLIHDDLLPMTDLFKTTTQ